MNMVVEPSQHIDLAGFGCSLALWGAQLLAESIR